MADKKLDSIKFPGLPDRYVVRPSISDVTGLQTALDGKVDAEDVYNGFVSETLQGSISSFDDGADDIPVKSLVAEIVPVQSGSGDPSPDNVRAISGWTEANVSVTGVNIWDEEWELGTIDTSGVPSPSNATIRSKNYIPVVPNTTYYCKGEKTYFIHFYDADKTWISLTSKNNETFTTPNNARYILFRLSSGTTYNNDMSINYPSTDHDYHAFSGEVYAISFASAGTVYGGRLDVTSGVLTVTWLGVDLGEQTYTDNGAISGGKQFYFRPTGKKNGTSNIMSDIFKVVANSETIDTMSGRSTNDIVSFNTTILTATAFKTAMSGRRLVYELATPQTYQLTPTEVKTLLGNNNVWADTGDIDLTYRADLGLYLDKIINA